METLSNSNRKRVLVPVERDGKTWWLRAGAGFVNKDQSINLYLDVLPVNGKLQIREWDDAPWKGPPGRGGELGEQRSFTERMPESRMDPRLTDPSNKDPF
jgi:hypothetical protein